MIILEYFSYFFIKYILRLIIRNVSLRPFSPILYRTCCEHALEASQHMFYGELEKIIPDLLSNTLPSQIL